MNRFLLLLGILTAVAPACSAQRVLYTSQMAQTPYTGPAIKNIRPHWPLASTITVVYADGRKQDIPKDSIWGYVNRRGQIYRYFRNDFYKVVDTGNLIRYNLLRSTGRGVANMRYFSQTLDSPIRWTKAKASSDSIAVR